MKLGTARSPARAPVCQVWAAHLHQNHSRDPRRTRQHLLNGEEDCEEQGQRRRPPTLDRTQDSFSVTCLSTASSVTQAPFGRETLRHFNAPVCAGPLALQTGLLLGLFVFVGLRRLLTAGPRHIHRSA
ncbi:hypothetical protein SKAU_G00185860 [Synaphobranchus kaupii]|uniref:Uncharacterized protein n=1 Tax=Synaphobranchus kaupii TaxID=118154 RepID=A0A9Q1IUP8_SYNKA|nr:hypothetical protein SKAU_G00185860 [Synaphobranchus kaupii]